ncbi:outer membrane protein assembly factor BamB [Polaromonas sp.]|jgi:outer membrane assembly lipoprotein YfgL|uniref:outer membrane protein assembly factor BamB n=1 Tax=Polaromonas sp. TaxID=1869339 RepID=UPI001D8A2CD0|nr:outer membrane protein assembly factor BamB [Polaromonas sp.]MBT9474699.1 outer membrane protein assembly factor BamB [Polaromonas sp.]
MSRQSFASLTLSVRAPVAILLVAALSGCFGGVKKPQPAELQPVVALVSASQSWSTRIGTVRFPLEVAVSGNTVALASGDGTVALLEATTGRDVWRMALNTPIAAGAGSDGKVVAVVTKANDVVALQDGREIWRQKLGAQVFTAPLVAGARVFVLAADRSVNAFDGQTGRKLWSQQRPTEPLVLRQSGVLRAVGDTLVAGLSGRLAGLNPSNGSIQWEAPIASPRGINDVERLVDLVGRVSRVGDTVCARAFQASIGCVNAVRGSLLWTKPASGAQGIDGDERFLFGTESDGTVMAWRRNDGERVWSTDRLRYRGLTAPLMAGRSIAIGDSSGFVHLLSREDGSLFNRLPTDGSAIVASPVLAGNTLIAVTQNGGVYGFKPE